MPSSVMWGTVRFLGGLEHILTNFLALLWQDIDDALISPAFYL